MFERYQTSSKILHFTIVLILDLKALQIFSNASVSINALRAALLVLRLSTFIWLYVFPSNTGRPSVRTLGKPEFQIKASWLGLRS